MTSIIHIRLLQTTRVINISRQMLILRDNHVLYGIDGLQILCVTWWNINVRHYIHGRLILGRLIREHWISVCERGVSIREHWVSVHLQLFSSGWYFIFALYTPVRVLLIHDSFTIRHCGRDHYFTVHSTYVVRVLVPVGTIYAAMRDAG